MSVSTLVDTTLGTNVDTIMVDTSLCSIVNVVKMEALGLVCIGENDVKVEVTSVVELNIFVGERITTTLEDVVDELKTNDSIRATEEVVV